MWTLTEQQVKKFNMESILLKNLSKSFVRKLEVGASKGRRERRTILRDVSLEAETGEILCVLGKNGSGKTTLIRILSTLIEPDAGEARLLGFDIVRESRDVRKRIGVMLNAGEGGFYHRLSALSNLEYYAALYHIPMRLARTRVSHLLSELGLGDRENDQVQSYSSGMKRRLALVRALLPDPPVLLLDEPTLGVDPWSTERIHLQLRQLSKEGKTILCATNNIGEARALGDRTYLLENGTLSVEPQLRVESA